ncbi:MAG: hypothetical protein EOR96_31715 [Mesorhizobium sp.]|nr:MAG: hypothetical protein EOR96_31715 [Mesorhizobium sp.]
MLTESIGCAACRSRLGVDHPFDPLAHAHAPRLTKRTSRSDLDQEAVTRSVRARTAARSHLDRANWMVTTGYKLFSERE